MVDLYYEERKVARWYFIIITLSGEVFLFTAFSFSLIGVLSGDTNFRPEAPWIALTALVIWSVLGLYIVFNVPQKLILSDDKFEVQWRRNNRIRYDLSKIELKTVWLSTWIKIRDEGWRLWRFSIPRYMVLDGSSKKYKEFIRCIKCEKFRTP
jgi:hypothetical protein